MKKIAGPIRVELAQYRELAAFAQFGSELDKNTRDRLLQGERIMEILKQPQYKPMPVTHQVLILYAVTHKYLMDIPLNQVQLFETEFLQFIELRYPQIIQEIEKQEELSKDIEKELIEALDVFKKQFTNQ